MPKKRLAALRDDVAGAEEANWDDSVVRGTQQELEKSYFRLTGASDHASVRPEPVLERALERLLGLLRAGGESYFYALDQFKGMRQDCTVQHLRNGLTVRVYEAHARAALEYGDVPEYNQCQTQLAVLHGEGLPGCHDEFLAYRILYQTAHARQGERLALLQTLRRAMAPARGPARLRASAGQGPTSAAVSGYVCLEVCLECSACLLLCCCAGAVCQWWPVRGKRRRQRTPRSSMRCRSGRLWRAATLQPFSRCTLQRPTWAVH